MKGRLGERVVAGFVGVPSQVGPQGLPPEELDPLPGRQNSIGAGEDMGGCQGCR